MMDSGRGSTVEVEALPKKEEETPLFRRRPRAGLSQSNDVARPRGSHRRCRVAPRSKDATTWPGSLAAGGRMPAGNIGN